MLVLFSLWNIVTHSQQINHIGLVFGFCSKINKYLSVQAELNRWFSLLVLHLGEKNLSLGLFIVLLQREHMSWING